MRLGVLLAASAAGALLATGAVADPQKLTFDGTITNGTTVNTTYVATYSYDPSEGMLTTTSAVGGLVTTSYAGPAQVTITFDGASYTIDDDDAANPSQIIRSDETQVSPPSVEYIATAADATASITNLIEVKGGVATFAFGSFEQLLNGDVVAAYALTPDTVSAAPEPSTWMLMISGMAGLGLTLRYARKTSKLNASSVLAS